jgi:glucose-6-phosphate isomerase
MISIDFSGAKFDSPAEKIVPFLDQFQKSGQGFFEALDDDMSMLKHFASDGKSFSKTVVLGIGGSALGARMLRDALGGQNLEILDTIDPVAVGKIKNIETTRFIVISKSGNTLETKKLLEYFWDKSPHENFIVLTEEGSSLQTWAKGESVHKILAMSPNIGGRFSVLTSVGILPAIFANIDMDGVLTGARAMWEKFQSSSAEENLPFQLASAIVNSGKSQLVHFPYADSLRTMGEWWTQLVAESTGKQGKGFTPINAVGPTDQHSLLQLLTEGPDSFFTIFIKNVAAENTSLGDIMNTELKATAQSLTELGRPNCTIEMNDISPETVGELIALWMGTVVFMGSFLGVDVYNQPGVERGKVIAKETMRE